jgi:peptide/nickel transport system substrate-binding protein
MEEFNPMKYRFILLLTLVSMCALPLSGITAAQEAPKYSESPMLAERVAAGELPPVDERLPENPRVMELPWTTVGTYGGQLRVPFGGDSPFWGG